MQKGRVYAKYEAHSPGQKFKLGIKKAKTYILENPLGQKKGDTPSFFSIWPSNTYEQTFQRELLKARRKGKIVISAETGGLGQLKALKNMATRSDTALREMTTAKSLKSIKNFFSAETRYNNYRHSLAAKTVKEASTRGKTEIIMGAMHSPLTKDLRKQGLKVAHKIKPVLFDHGSIVIRKLMLGKKPTELDYLRAGVSEINSVRTLGEINRFLFGKSRETSANFNFACALQKTMLDSLSKEQLEQVLNENRPSLIFEFNNLPDPIGSFYSKKEHVKREYIEFLEGNKAKGWKGSEFWKRLPETVKRKMAE